LRERTNSEKRQGSLEASILDATMPDTLYSSNHVVNIDVIFLDIDGVLLPFGEGGVIDNAQTGSSCGAIFPDEALKTLGDILDATKAKLVLSSTWRAKKAFVDDIIESFRKYGGKYGGILSTVDFYDSTDVHYHGERQWEIQKWLNNQKEINTQNRVRAWIALDDEELIEGEENSKYRNNFVGHTVKTDSAVGLTPQDGDIAIHLLKGQMR